MLLFFSYLPIMLLIYFMTRKNNLPSHKALPLCALLLYFIMLIVFQRDPNLVHAAVFNGLLVAWTPILIIGGAILLFRTLEASGGMDIIRTWLNGITNNKIAQLMIVAWAFPFLIEGASGFGTPAALAAPVLVGLGFKPLRVAIAALIMNSVPVTFGAVGTPTWFGFSGIQNLSNPEILEIGVKSAFINSIAALVMPAAALLFFVSFKEIKRNAGFIYISILGTVFPYYVIAHFNYEFPSIIGGFSGLIVSVFAAKRGLGLAKERTRRTVDIVPVNKLIKSSFPLWGTLIVLIITRIPQLGIKALLTDPTELVSFTLGSLGNFSISSSLTFSLSNIFGTDYTWNHKLLYVPSLIPFLMISVISMLLSKMQKSEIKTVFTETAYQLKKPVLALFGALVFVNLMMMGKDLSAVSNIGDSLAKTIGPLWQYFAAFLGAIGSFFSGSNTISNLTFGGIQDTIARTLQLNRTTILALQSAGGAMGNMISINNIVAVCSVLAITNQEGTVLKKTFPVVLVYGAIAALGSILI